MTVLATCAYCGKEFEPNKTQVLHTKKGKNVYCSKECRIKNQMLSRGITEEEIIKKIAKAGGEIKQHELLSNYSKSDRLVVMEFISLLTEKSILIKEKDVNQKYVLKLADRMEVNVVEDAVNNVEDVKDVKAKEEVEIVEDVVGVTDVANELTELKEEVELEKIVDSIDIRERVSAVDDKLKSIEERVELLEKDVQALRRVFRKVLTKLAPAGE